MQNNLAIVFLHVLVNRFSFAVCGISLNYEELEKIIYDINLKDQPFGYNKLIDSSSRLSSIDSQDAKTLPEIPESSLMLSNRNGQQFLCNIPDISSLISSQSEEDSYFLSVNQNISTETILDSLSLSFTFRPCLKKTVSWWTYEVCFNRLVQQYHLNDNEMEGSVISLGYFVRNVQLGSAEGPPGKKKNMQTYFAQVFEGGSLCELNSHLRKTEVQYFCDEELSHEDAYIHRIDEPLTCQYLISVHVGSLCKLKQFQPIGKPIQAKTILCEPLLSVGNTVKYVQKQLEMERRKREAESAFSETFEKIEEQMNQIKNMNEDQRRRHITWKDMTLMTELDKLSMESVLRKKFTAYYLYEEPRSDQNKRNLWQYFNDKTTDRSKFPILLREEEKEAGNKNSKNHFENNAIVKNGDVGDMKALEKVMNVAKNVLTQSKLRILRERMAAELDNAFDELYQQMDRHDKDQSRNSQKMSHQLESGDNDEEETEKDVQVSIERDDSSKEKHNQHEIRRRISLDTQRLQEQLVNKLKKAGFDSDGKKVQIKVITDSYDEKNEAVNVVDSEHLSNLIVSILGLDTNQKVERQRSEKIERNYAFPWNDYLDDQPPVVP